MKNLNELPLMYWSLSNHAPASKMKRKDLEQDLKEISDSKEGFYSVSQEKIPERWMKGILSSQAKIRTFFDKSCFRVDDSYAIPIASYPTFQAEVDKLKADADAHVNALVEAFHSGELVREAVANVGKAIRGLQAQGKTVRDLTADEIEEMVIGYLPKSEKEIRTKIWVEVRKKADLNNPVIAKALDNLATDARDQAKAEIKADHEALEANGQANIVSFVLDEVVHFLQDFQNRVGVDDSKGKKYKTLLDKMNRVTQELPAYNVTGNPVIANAIERIYESFKGLDADCLRDDKTYRETKVEIATDILKEIQGVSDAPATDLDLGGDESLF